MKHKLFFTALWLYCLTLTATACNTDKKSQNGVATADWTYDALMRRVVVSVPASSCGEQVVVRLQRSASGISQVDGAALVSQRYFDLMGREYSYPPKGSYIVRRTFANGQVVTQKFTR